MKRLVIAALVVLVVLAFAGIATVGSAFAGLTESKPGRVAPGVELVKDGFVNVFLIDVDQGVVLIDCGNDPTGKAIIETLAHRTWTENDVKAIFLTHGHGDHTAACNRFPNAAVYAFEGDRGLIEETASAKGPLTKWMRPDPTRAVLGVHWLKDAESVIIGGVDVTAWNVPGHTSGSAAYLSKGVLFLGDSAGSQTDGHLRGAPGLFSDDPAQNVASMKALPGRLDGRTVTHLAFAHSGWLAGTGELAAFAK
jgi:glyoxylase-like metal-dependent hydrolase (beta-lactamase superfamily II)